MAGKNNSKASDITFEGVVIPKGTRSAKIARKGITDVVQMGDFLTAVFSDTLKGKIMLPKSHTSRRASSHPQNGLEQRLSNGVPVKIHQTKLTSHARPRSKRSKRSAPEKS